MRHAVSLHPRQGGWDEHTGALGQGRGCGMGAHFGQQESRGSVVDTVRPSVQARGI